MMDTDGASIARKATPEAYRDQAAPVPSLPIEVELLIFNLAARSDYPNALRLLWVAKRVHSWIKPIIYEAVFLRYEHSAKQFFDEAAKLGPSFLSRNLKTLFISGIELRSFHPIASCTGVDYLALSTPILYDLVKDFRPRRMTLLLPSLLESSTETISFNFPLFSRVTHLELFSSYHHAPFELIPCLTHLALDEHFSSLTRLEGVIEGAIGKCKRLEAILILAATQQYLEQIRTKFADLFKESSVVILFGLTQLEEEDWRDFSRGEDPWLRARDYVVEPSFVPMCSV